MAALLVSALASPPARAADTVGTVLSATTVGSPPAGYGNSGGGGAMTPPSPAGATAPPDNPQPTPTAEQNNTAANTQTTTATGGGGGRATGGNAGSSQVAGGGSHGGNAYANGGNAESYSSLENQQSNQTSGRDSSGSGYSGNGGQDVFVLEATKPRGSGGAAARRNHARSRRDFGVGAANRATRLEVMEPRDHETAKASPLGDGLPGHGGQLPGHNPFFSLLSGSGDAGAGLILLLLAVLGASIALPNYRFKAFRTPTVTWRPLAYVPPIELPG